MALRRRRPPLFERRSEKIAKTKENAIKTAAKWAERFVSELDKKKLLLICICTDKHKCVSSIELTFHSWIISTQSD